MLIYAYDTQPDGAELGPGSKERLDLGIKYITESKAWNDWIIILGAGCDPKRPEVLTHLKTMMSHYIVKALKAKGFRLRNAIVPGTGEWFNEAKKIRIMISRRDVWGSFNETTSALDTFFEVYKDKVGFYYAVSADFHLPRIELIWFMLGFPVKTIGTPWKPTWKEKLLEPVKMIKVVLLGIWHSIKRGF